LVLNPRLNNVLGDIAQFLGRPVSDYRQLQNWPHSRVEFENAWGIGVGRQHFFGEFQNGPHVVGGVGHIGAVGEIYLN